MTTHTIDTTTGQNIGQSIINYLDTNNLAAKVEVITVHTTKHCRTRLRTTTFTTKPKLS